MRAAFVDGGAASRRAASHLAAVVRGATVARLVIPTVPLAVPLAV